MGPGRLAFGKLAGSYAKDLALSCVSLLSSKQSRAGPSWERVAVSLLAHRASEFLLNAKQASRE